MANRRTSRPSAPNPVAVVLGSALRSIRERQGKTLATVAEKAGIKDSFLRLIESGRNHLAVSKAHFLVSSFDSDVSYEALVFLLSSISSSEERANKVVCERGQVLHENLLRIANLLSGSHPFRQFVINLLEPVSEHCTNLSQFVRFRGMSSELSLLQSLDPLQQTIRDLVENSDYVESATRFLLGPHTFDVSSAIIGETYQNRFFAEIPTVYKWLLDDVRENILALPITFTPEGSWAWESQNRSRFAELCGVCYARHLIDINNLKRYSFNYLLERRFRKATFLLLDDDDKRDASTLKEDFWKTLRSALEAKGTTEAFGQVHKLGPSQRDKIEFQRPDSGARNRIGELLRHHDSETGPPFNALWVFKTDDTALVGAISHIDEQSRKATHIKFLSFEDTARITRRIQEYYNVL